MKYKGYVCAGMLFFGTGTIYLADVVNKSFGQLTQTKQQAQKEWEQYLLSIIGHEDNFQPGKVPEKEQWIKERMQKILQEKLDSARMY